MPLPCPETQRRVRLALTGAALALGAACAGGGTVPASNPAAPDLISAAIETDAEGRCYGRDIQPAVIQTVTAQELERAAVLAEDGSVVSQAVYRSVIRQQIVRERQEVLFETLCPPDFTAAFVENLQRALRARGYYGGPVNGNLDSATRRAIQDFQRDGGPDSPILSLASARRLGLVALSADQIDALDTAR